MGVQQSSRVPIFKDGSIYIELDGDRVGFQQGAEIHGTVHVRQVGPFEADKLTLALIGEEFTYLRKSVKNKGNDEMKTMLGNRQIINMVFPIAHY